MIKAIGRYFMRKAMDEMRHSGSNSFFMSAVLSNTKYDYLKDVGDGTTSSVLMAPIQWLQRAFNEAPLDVLRETKDSPDKINNHAMVRLIRKPNEFYTGSTLWRATILSYIISGFAYWRKIRNAAGVPVELWWIPTSTLTPKWPDSGKVFISHYHYDPGQGRGEDIDVNDIVHFRHGLDPLNPRLGMSPLKSIMREAWMDNEASNFVASVLRNGGVPGVIVSPKGEGVLDIDVEMMKKYIRESFGGDRRGEPMVIGAPTDVKQFGWSPSELDLSSVRNVAEERVCACLGIPAAVVGFGSGLEQTKVGATMKELVRSAWVDGVLPIQRNFADEMTRSLLPDFSEHKETDRAEFTTSSIQALEEDLTERFRRADIGVRSGWLSVAQAKRMVGIEPEKQDEIYLRTFAIVEVPARSGMPKQLTNGMMGTKTTHDIDPIDALVIANAERRKPGPGDLAALRAMDKVGVEQSLKFERELILWFDEIGAEVARAADEVLESKELADEIDVEKILNGTNFDDLLASGLRKYDTHYSQVARQTFDGLGVAFNSMTDLPDVAARKILAAGGRRLGLIDLNGGTKDRLFQILTTSREEGLGVDAIKRLIRDTVGAGPWADSNIRGRVVARTETKYAQNVSVNEYARETQASNVLVFDARLGPTDAECEALDGVIVSVSEAEALAASEHPNGTRSFTPWYE